MGAGTGLIVVLCRNSLVLTKRCIRSVQKQEGVALRILAIDNASQDGVTEYLRAAQAQDNRIWIMSLKQPLGVSAAWNRAMWWAGEKGYRELLILNNDVEILPETYNILSDYMQETDAGMVTGVEQLPGSNIDYTAGEWQESNHPHFSCFLIALDTYKLVGGFDEDFEGAYFEDNDYHIRMHRAGVRAVAIDLPFLHHRSGTLNNASPEEQEAITCRFERNKQRFAEKWGCYPGTERYDQMFA